MPLYDYYCAHNQLTVEVEHPMTAALRNWGELCYAAQIPLGDTDPLAPICKVIRAPYLSAPTGNSQLRETGFTKLVRRDQGLYENVTSTEGQKRFVRSDNDGSLPEFTDKSD